jgi:hypothetical protein
MKAVTSAGKKRYAAKAGFTLALASSLLPEAVMAANPVDQIERLVREQQALQSSQSMQIQSLRQQLDSQAIENQTQDWLLAGSLAGILLMALMGAWLLARWPHWQLQSQARQAKRMQKAPQREKYSLPPEQLEAAFAASGLQSGEVIDHSGHGMVKRLVKQKKRHQKKLAERVSEPTPDSEWLIQLDELDSQFLADEALREYELKKTVGLISAEDDDGHTTQLEQSKAVGLDDVWHSLQEVPLVPEHPEAAKPETAKPDAANVDVSLEVQRVRKSLQERRKKRHLQAVAIAQSVVEEAEQSLDLEVPESEPITPSQPEPVCSQKTSEPTEELVLSYVQEQEQEPSDRYTPSVRSMTDAETRLALAHEFEKLGQMAEAAQLCEEVLASGSPEEQTKAQRFLRQMPGR